MAKPLPSEPPPPPLHLFLTCEVITHALHELKNEDEEIPVARALGAP